MKRKVPRSVSQKIYDTHDSLSEALTQLAEEIEWDSVPTTKSSIRAVNKLTLASKLLAEAVDILKAENLS